MSWAWKRKLAGSRLFRRALEEPPLPEGMKPKFSPRFIAPLIVIGLSFLLAWPLISLLGFLAVRRHQPALFTIGSPIAYGFSTLVFFVGVALAGKEGLRYCRSLLCRLLARFHARFLSPKEEHSSSGGKVKRPGGGA